MKGICAIHLKKDVGCPFWHLGDKTVYTDEYYVIWSLKDGKYNPDYTFSGKYLTEGEAKKHLVDWGYDKTYLLVSEEDFKNEVKRRKNIVKNDFVYRGAIV